MNIKNNIIYTSQTDSVNCKQEYNSTSLIQPHTTLLNKSTTTKKEKCPLCQLVQMFYWRSFKKDWNWSDSPVTDDDDDDHSYEEDQASSCRADDER